VGGGEGFFFWFLFIYFWGLKLKYHIIESFQVLCIVIMVIDSVGFFFFFFLGECVCDIRGVYLYMICANFGYFLLHF
jgi:hypothetical protein